MTAGLSEPGAAFIGHYEGWRDAPYNDPTNNATIGFGHLIHMGRSRRTTSRNGER